MPTKKKPDPLKKPDQPNLIPPGLSPIDSLRLRKVPRRGAANCTK